ncbi:transposase [Synoicihabitans lomoniglobus]|uniref:Transposase n=1 Tax=Synoicihabitans lomoniglobus TaxID=2909285 RepID=A0AAE9ZZL7_9BACT|nr:transposase [Opitutaceae bacterium LMO-M01]
MGASYFLTLCTEHRCPGLTTSILAEAVIREVEILADDDVWRLQALTIMPDHVHVLVALGAKLDLSPAISRFKAKTKGALQSGNLHWERGYFDHRIRPDDKLAPVLRYMALNPFRAGLTKSTEQVWPWFRLGEVESNWFRPGFPDDDESTHPAWLKK